MDDTIKEYIESESSLSVIFESSSASLPGDMLANTDETSFAFESSVMSKTETDLAVSDDVPPVDCLDAENKAQEGAELITRPAQVSDNAANSPEHVGFVDEGMQCINFVILDSLASVIASVLIQAGLNFFARHYP